MSAIIQNKKVAAGRVPAGSIILLFLTLILPQLLARLPGRSLSMFTDGLLQPVTSLSVEDTLASFASIKIVRSIQLLTSLLLMAEFRHWRHCPMAHWLPADHLHQ